ncbi:hypothetical protein KC19_2G017000 [Ceratodon purpureus]|uniref:C2 domain-containing protein n=1 Tax=Ceratodon purpureus TaxID=3225 RepID=A0A8T0ISX7_CERPU|nr:hypothetical protein KC19_2G017000 [Ceratodon purpureus]
MPHGKLTIVVEGATNIKTPGVNGRGSSYCTLACGSQVFSSPTVEGGGSHPLFNTWFEFEIDRTTNELDVCVYSKSSTYSDDDLVGHCTLSFKKVFYHGHTVPLTAFAIQQPSGNPGGNINMSLTFKMRPSPNVHNTHVPTRCSSTPRVVHKIVGRQSLSLDWGYDCHGDDAKNYRRTQSDPPRHHEDYLNVPGTASDNHQETKPHRHHEDYLNLPGTASDNHQETKPHRHHEHHQNFPGTAPGNYHEPKPSFIRYGNPTKLRPQSPQTPNHARPSPMTDYTQPVVNKPKPLVNKPNPIVYKPQPIVYKPQPIVNKPQPQVFIQPQVYMPVQHRPNLLVEFGGEAVNGVCEGVAGEVANQVMGGVGEALMNGIGQAVLGSLFNFQ